MSSNYRNGADLERAAKRVLEDNGYYVIKSAGSKGIVDLAAFKPGEILFVQCKASGYVAPAERDKLYDLAKSLYATALTASWRKEGNAARQVAFCELAGRVLHWDWSPDYGIADAHANAHATERAT